MVYHATPNRADAFTGVCTAGGGAGNEEVSPDATAKKLEFGRTTSSIPKRGAWLLGMRLCFGVGTFRLGGRDTRRKRGGEEIRELFYLAGGNLSAAL